MKMASPRLLEVRNDTCPIGSVEKDPCVMAIVQWPRLADHSLTLHTCKKLGGNVNAKKMNVHTNVTIESESEWQLLASVHK